MFQTIILLTLLLKIENILSSKELSKVIRYKVYAELLDLDTRKKGYKEKELDFKRIDKKFKIVNTNWFLKLPGNWGFKSGLIPNKGIKVRETGNNVTFGISAFLYKR